MFYIIISIAFVNLFIITVATCVHKIKTDYSKWLPVHAQLLAIACTHFGSSWSHHYTYAYVHAHASGIQGEYIIWRSEIICEHHVRYITQLDKWRSLLEDGSGSFAISFKS